MGSNSEYNDQSSKTKKKLLDHLYNPVKLRFLATTAMLLIAYFGVFTPLNGGMETTAREISKERKRLELGREVEKLRSEYQKFKDRVPKHSDPNEYMTFLIAGIESCGAVCLNMAPDDSRDVGPYKATVLKVDVGGDFGSLDKLLDWLETNKRMIRVDSVKIYAQRNQSGLVMQLVVLGIMG